MSLPLLIEDKPPFSQRSRHHQTKSISWRFQTNPSHCQHMSETHLWQQHSSFRVIWEWGSDSGQSDWSSSGSDCSSGILPQTCTETRPAPTWMDRRPKRLQSKPSPPNLDVLLWGFAGKCHWLVQGCSYQTGIMSMDFIKLLIGLFVMLTLRLSCCAGQSYERWEAGSSCYGGFDLYFVLDKWVFPFPLALRVSIGSVTTPENLMLFGC